MQFYATHILCPEHYARILWRDIGHKAGLMPYINLSFRNASVDTHLVTTVDEMTFYSTPHGAL